MFLVHSDLNMIKEQNYGRVCLLFMGLYCQLFLETLPIRYLTEILLGSISPKPFHPHWHSQTKTVNDTVCNIHFCHIIIPQNSAGFHFLTSRLPSPFFLTTLCTICTSDFQRTFSRYKKRTVNQWGWKKPFGEYTLTQGQWACILNPPVLKCDTWDSSCTELFRIHLCEGSHVPQSLEVGFALNFFLTVRCPDPNKKTLILTPAIHT